MEVCTIIAKNYLSHARVLARSLAEHAPGSRLWTLIIDDYTSYIDPAHEPFEVLSPSDIGCDAFTYMALRYTVLELSTAVKPWLLRHLMELTGQPVTYLDPDIKVYGPLDELDELARRHGVALIPHNNVPIPLDGRRPSQVDVMIAGVYNLGYVSVAPGSEVDHLLDWWAERLRRDCRVDPIWGYFVDQRWFDLVPGFLTEFAIIRDPEYNLAYWNLHSRRLEHDGQRYLVDGRPLAFFHFSGFDPRHPLILSRHQDRIDVAAHPVLERLLGEYARDVMGQEHAVSSRWPYSYLALGDGTQIDEVVRSFCEEFADEHEGNGQSVLSPFTLAGARNFHEWLASDAPGSPPGVNRVLARVYQQRGDLRERFPDLRGSDRNGLLDWVRKYGVHEIPLLAKVSPVNADGHRDLPSEPDGLPPLEAGSSTPADNPAGVNVVGSFASDREVGEVARQILRAFDQVGIPAVPVDEPARQESEENLDFSTVGPEGAAYGVNLICLPPGGLVEFVRHAGERFFAGRYSIGLWFETESTAEETLTDAASLLQEIWTPSSYVAEQLRPHVSNLVRAVPIPVRPAQLVPLSRAALGMEDGRCVFLSSFDLSDGLARPNPIGVIDAFTRAFGPSDAVRLIIDCVRGEFEGPLPEELRAAAAGHPSVELVEAAFSRPESVARLSLADCYVSLHRADAFGFTLAQAMSLGKPVIATGYSGNLEFMDEENSWLVKARPSSSSADTSGHAWCEPDLEHAAELMRRAYEDPGARRELGALAAAELARKHSPYVSAEIMRRRLESIRATGRASRGLPPARGRSRALDYAQAVVNAGPTTTARTGPGRRARGTIRAAVLRALKPYTSYQEKANAAILAAVEELNTSLRSSIEELHEQSAAERAEIMAELRGISNRPVVSDSATATVQEDTTA